MLIRTSNHLIRGIGILALFLLLSISSASAHGDGVTISEVVDGFVVDVDFDSQVIESGYPGRFSFNLFGDETRTKEVPFARVWVRVVQDDDSKLGKTIFSGWVAQAVFGSTGMSITLPKSGNYKLIVRYNNENDEKIVEATLPFTVIPGAEEQSFQLAIEFWAGIAIGAVLILVGVVPAAYKMGRRKSA